MKSRETRRISDKIIIVNLVIEALWLRLHSVLAAFAEKLCAPDLTLIQRLARTANDTFLLRGYLALSKHSHGDEIAITIDVRSTDQQLVVESEACMDDGSVIAVGPSAVIPLSDGNSSVDSAIEDWLREFERFLKNNESTVAKAIAQLT